MLERNRHAGAVYLAGYTVECILKWAITDRNELVYLPEKFETHHWDTLPSAAGLGTALKNNKKMLGVYSELVEQWQPNLRYRAHIRRPKEVRDLYDKMKEVYTWIIEQCL